MNYKDKLAHHERKFKMWAWLMFYSFIFYVVLAFVNFELAKFYIIYFMLTASLAIYHIQTARAILWREMRKTREELNRILTNRKR